MDVKSVMLKGIGYVEAACGLARQALGYPPMAFDEAQVEVLQERDPKGPFVRKFPGRMTLTLNPFRRGRGRWECVHYRHAK